LSSMADKTSFFSPIPSIVRTPAPRVRELTARTELSSCRGMSSVSFKPAPRSLLELTIMGTGGKSGSASLAGSHSTKVRPEASLGGAHLVDDLEVHDQRDDHGHSDRERATSPVSPWRVWCR